MTVTHETDPREQTLDERIVDVMAEAIDWQVADFSVGASVQLAETTLAALRGSGFEVVPVEPTAKMCAATYGITIGPIAAYDDAPSPRLAREIYEVMLAAVRQ